MFVCKKLVVVTGGGGEIIPKLALLVQGGGGAQHKHLRRKTREHKRLLTLKNYAAAMNVAEPHHVETIGYT